LNARLLVAGSGKMARDIGLFFLKRGCAVSWLSRDADRLAALEKRIRKSVRRLAALSADPAPDPQVSFHPYDDPQVPAPDVIIECVNESLPDKRHVFRRLEPLAPDDAILAGSSSSILPSQIHPRCIGLHFFHPTELTGLVEMVTPGAYPRPFRARLKTLLRECGVEIIEQTERTAFAVNRLLLPLQAECLRALVSGSRAQDVDAASASELLPMGQLRFMDSVGLDVIHPAACNYVQRMAAGLAADYAPLEQSLKQLLDMGKRGAKNRDGLLLGQPLPWPSAPDARPGPDALHKNCLYLLINTCYHFLESGQLTESDLVLVLNSLFQSESSFQEIVQHEGSTAILDALARQHAETGFSYFAPAPALKPR